ncbi:helix-turn-helix domain-containing protein [Seonamhaeicola sp. MEBiC1930]|uniref:helix-turn-helix domain-containing protein n=1 Tax=Seonamhaeicola sp. MEBiC01930 TaxID=2976768 RepID=UPI00324EC811
MINTIEFAKRLKKVMEHHSESASSFAEKIEVQRSSISHILSGRNKPSLEFVLKVLSSYPEVELYWLLNGKGSFPSTQNNVEAKNEIEEVVSEHEKALKAKSEINVDDKTIERIVIFYSDGTFKNFNN